jgi:hypothetical protein
MNALGTRLLAVSLVGILALPKGYCCEQSVPPVAASSGNCCQRGDHPSRVPETATKACCCQDRLTTTQAAKVRKRSVADYLTFWPLADPEVFARSGRTALLPKPVLIPPGKHSLQATLCVWRL